MRVFVISDTHFEHRKLVEFGSRPLDFEKRIIRNWKKMVGAEDLVVHLGDVLVGRTSKLSSIIPGLPGRKILVLGNHDQKKASWYMNNNNGFDFCCESFSWNMFGLEILFSHKPEQSGSFDLNVHGHLHLPQRHAECPVDGRHYLVSLEQNGYQPELLRSIVNSWQNRRKGT